MYRNWTGLMIQRIQKSAERRKTKPNHRTATIKVIDAAEFDPSPGEELRLDTVPSPVLPTVTGTIIHELLPPITNNVRPLLRPRPLRLRNPKLAISDLARIAGTVMRNMMTTKTALAALRDEPNTTRDGDHIDTRTWTVTADRIDTQTPPTRTKTGDHIEMKTTITPGVEQEDIARTKRKRNHTVPRLDGTIGL